MDSGEIEVRHTEPHERLAVTNAKGVALLANPMSQAVFDENENSWDDCASISAWDGSRCVGHVGAYAFEVTVSGGARLPMAGVTRVGVLPTHTRRGLLRRMMEPILREARDAGQVLSALHASETAIYRSFGYGLGIEAAAVEVDTRGARPRRRSAGRGSMTVLEPHEVDDAVPGVYERAARHRPGTIGRERWVWDRLLRDYAKASERGFGSPAKVIAVHDTDGERDGYVRYTVQWDEDFGSNPTGVGDVHELWGAAPEVEAALWDYLLDVDLITTWRLEGRPLGDPITRTLADSRAYRTIAVHDDQWVRLLDVDAALRARAYGPLDESFVIEVTDPMFADNCGRWEIAADGAHRTDRGPDLAVAIDAVSALYQGGQSWRDLATIGEVQVVTGDAGRVLARADAAFSVRPLPFCGTPY